MESGISNLRKIISGGQTGADMAALKAAKTLGIETGGTAPKGYLTTEGECPELGFVYGLDEDVVECKGAAGYVRRSMFNVDNADGTVAFRMRSSPGTDSTIGYCLSRKWKPVLPQHYYRYPHPYKPVIVLSKCVDSTDSKLSWPEERDRLLYFIRINNIQTLNICGHRQTADDITWQTRVEEFLLYALKG